MNIYGEATTVIIDVDGNTMYVDSIAVNKVAKGGDTMTGCGDTMTGRSYMAGNNISNVSNPISNQDAATKSYVNTLGALKVAKDVDIMGGALYEK